MPASAKRRKSPWAVSKQNDVALFFGVSLATVQGWAKQGMPGRQGAYDVSEVVQWLRSVGPWRQHARVEDADPDLGADAGDSPGLERYRLAKAAIAELELEQRKGSLISRDKARPILARLASGWRRCGERLAKRFGPEAAEIVNGAVSDFEANLDHDLGGDNAPDCPAGD